MLAVLALIVFFVASVSIGSSSYTILDVFYGRMPRIILELRLSRSIAAASTGTILALAGLTLQHMLRNNLADPYLLGVSPTAYTVVALCALTAPAYTTLYMLLTPAVALGGLLGTLLVLLLSRLAYDANRVILAGIAVATTFSGIGFTLDYLAASKWGWSPGHALFGGFAGVTTDGALVLGVAAATYTAYMLLRHSVSLEALVYGDDAAMLAGVDARRARLEALLVTSLAVSIVTAYTGMIGFIGLIAPNVARALAGVESRRVTVASVCIGASLALSADIAARLIGPLVGLGEVPAGALIAVVGGLGLATILIRGP